MSNYLEELMQYWITWIGITVICFFYSLPVFAVLAFLYILSKGL